MDLLNPWEVENITAFSYYCCPECVYRSQEEFTFQAHALQNHPKAGTFFHGFSDHDNDVFKVEVKHESEQNEKNQEIEAESQTIATIDESYDFSEHPDVSNDEETKSTVFNSKDDTDAGKNSKQDAVKHSQIYSQDNLNLLNDHIDIKETSNSDVPSKDEKCPTCLEAFSSLVEMALHFNHAHSKVKSLYHCPSCDKSHPSSSKLKIHVETVHLKKKTKCPICQSLVSLHGLRNHMRTSHNSDRVNKPFKCEECDFATHADRYLKTHVLKSHKKNEHSHSCDECNKKFPFPYLLVEHKEIVHQNLKTFMCEKCGKGFPKRLKYLFKEHVQRGDCLEPRKQNVKESVYCENCNEKFSGLLYLVQHYRKKHGSLPPAYNDKELFMCDQCPNVYLSKLSMKKHMKCVHLNKPVMKKTRQCPHCDKTFTTITCYKEHLAVKHEKNTPFKCDHCHRSYGTQDRLKVHKRNMHQRIKCDQCGQEICNAFILQRHKATVHGIKPTDAFQCPSCPLFFNQKASLDKHAKKHHAL